jgi:hypothetical protein
MICTGIGLALFRYIDGVANPVSFQSVVLGGSDPHRVVDHWSAVQHREDSLKHQDDRNSVIDFGPLHSIYVDPPSIEMNDKSA